LPSAAWRLHAALSSIRAPDGHVRITGFHDAVRAPSAESRAAVDEQGPALEEELREFFGVQQFVDDLTGRSVRRPCRSCGRCSATSASPA